MCSVNVVYVDRNGQQHRVKGKEGDNVLYLAHRYGIEMEGTYTCICTCIYTHVHVHVHVHVCAHTCIHTTLISCDSDVLCYEALLCIVISSLCMCRSM